MIYRFDVFEIDTDRCSLRRSGVDVPVEPQVLRLLTCLIEYRDRVVSRAELYEKVWHGRLVTEAALNSRIKAARAAVADDGKSQSLIRTFHRTGYRFVGRVHEAATGPERASQRGVEPSGSVEPILAAADTLDEVDLSLPNQPSVAILPFRPMGKTTDDTVLVDGLTHDVITQVARARWLFVAARGSTFKFDAGPYDARDVGRALGVRYVVQGYVQFFGDKVGVQVTLTDAVTGNERWADYFHRRLDDIMAIQAEISEIVVGTVESEIEHAERERSLLRTPESLDAWGAYHRGCWHMYRFTPEDYDRAEHFLRRSLELDPGAPRAYAALSFIHWQRAFLELTRDRTGEERRAVEYAERSLAIDARDPLGHWALGRALLLERDLDEAVDELETAVELNPSSAVGQYSLAYALMQLGKGSRSNEIVGKARRLSPYDAMTFAMYAVRAQNLAFAGRYTEAATFATRAARQPNAHYHVVAIAAFCNLLAGRLDDAHRHAQRLAAQRPAYSAADYLRAFRHQKPANVALVEQTFDRLRAV